MHENVEPHYQTAPIDDKPIIPPGPVLSAGTFYGGKSSHATLLDSKNILLVTSGRMALAIAMELENINSKHEVLIPSYHCSSMVSPVVHTGATPVFYKIKSNMEVDLAHIKQLANSATRAIIVPHYFGFPQNISELKKFCTESDILLIEDCAHAYFSKSNHNSIGRDGDYAIGSIMKFFPVFDGGCLVSNTKPLNAEILQNNNIMFELKSLLYTLELSFKYKRLLLLHILLYFPLMIKEKVWKKIKVHSKEREIELPKAPTASHGGFDFDSDWIYKKISKASKFILCNASNKTIINKRLINYSILLKEFSNSDQYIPLHPVISDGVVPYVFPLLITDESISIDSFFYQLRIKGIPVMRWEYLWDNKSESYCNISNRYSRRLIQIPCHQSLKYHELIWMTEEIKNGLSYAD